MGMDMDVSCQYLMGMGTDINVIFENEYKYGYNLTRSESAQLSFLTDPHNLCTSMTRKGNLGHWEKYLWWAARELEISEYLYSKCRILH